MTPSLPRFAILLALAAIAVCVIPGVSSAAGTFTVTSTLNFTVVTVGSTSNSQVATVSNGTAATVTISSITVIAPNQNDFLITANTCGTMLTSGSTCQITVVFKPTANDLREAFVQITDTAAGSPQLVSLTGFGQAPTQTLIFNPDIVTFPITNIGTTSSQISVQVTNFGTAGVTFSGTSLIGSDPSDFAIASNGCTSLSPGFNSCYITLSFTPAAAGARTASLEINSNAPGSPFVVLLLGTGQTLTQTISISPPSYSFLSEDIGSTSNQNYFTIQNTGTAQVAMNGITITGADASDFAIASNSCPPIGSPLAPGSSCYVYVTFTPNAAGTLNAALSVADTATGSPQTATLYGVGQTAISQIAFSKGTVDMGVETLHITTGASYVEVQNTGNSNVTFSSVALGGTDPGDFAVSSNSCSSGAIGPGSYCYVYVTFTPAVAGLRQATLTFTDNATGSPQVVNLEGTGNTVTQTLAFGYLDYDFGAYTVGVASSQQYFEVQNTGDSGVSFNSYTLTGTNPGDFLITSNNCPSPGTPLNAGSSCYLYITFTPAATGVRTAVLQFSDSATGSPQSINLAGVGLAATQTLSYSTPALVFTPVTEFASGGQLSVGVTNTGDQSITFYNVSITGTDPTDFSVASNQCTTLTAGSTCYVYVNYFPLATGILSATLQFTDTASGSPQSIPLASDGEASGGVLSLNTLLMNFGSVNVGSAGPTPTTVTVTNPTGATVSFTQRTVGPNASDFSTTNNTCTGSLTAGANCAVTMNITPGAAGQRLAALEFTANSVAQDVLLAGIGTAPSTVITLLNSLDFGQVNLGSSSTQRQLQIQNTGSLPVTFSGTSLSGTDPGDFSVASDTCTVIPAGQSCTIALVFEPAASNVRTAALTIHDSATGSPQSVTLSGIGQPAGAGLSAPAAVDMGSTSPGSPVPTSINLFNSGTATVTITSFALSGTNPTDFAVTQSQYCNTITAFSNCSLVVTFNPAAAGVRTATLKLTDNAAGSPQSITLTGVGVTATSTLSVPTALAFPATVTGSTNTQTASILNTGTATVSITNVSITGTNASDFSLNYSCGQISAFQSCPMSVNFSPGAAGVRTANLIITSNAAGSPQTITLDGVGQTPTRTLSLPQIIAFPVTTFGTISNVSFTVYNTGNQPVVFTKAAVVGANASDFTLGNWCSTINPGSSCSIQVSYSYVPGSTGVGTATVQFTDNATGSPQSVPLNGVVQGATTTVGLAETTLTFPSQAVGTVSGAQTIYIYNDGNGSVTMKTVTLTGTNPGDFEVTANSCLGSSDVLAGGDMSYCYVQVEFAPTAIGTRTATLQITDTAVGNVQTVALTGTGS